MPISIRALLLLSVACAGVTLSTSLPAYAAPSLDLQDPPPTLRGRSVLPVRKGPIRSLPPAPARSEARRPRVSASTSAHPAAMATGLLAAVNRERRRVGARSLRTDARLDRAATRYARELASRREIEHASLTPGLRTFRDRIHAAGARARIAGENLARLTASAHSLPDRTVRAWFRSPGHRANLLDPVWRRTGIGIWLGRDGVWYIVQLYATAD